MARLQEPEQSERPYEELARGLLDPQSDEGALRERSQIKAAKKTRYRQIAEDLIQLTPIREPTMAEKGSIALSRTIGSMAKAPQLAARVAEELGVPRGTIERHVPAITALAAKGAELEAIAQEAEPFPSTDFASELVRGGATTIPFLAAGPLGGGAGEAGAALGARLLPETLKIAGRLGAKEAFSATMKALGSRASIMLTGAAMTAVPIYEDVLEATGDEKKALTASIWGLGLGFSESIGLGEAIVNLPAPMRSRIRRGMQRMASGVAGSLEEGAQEFYQTLGEAITTGVMSDRDIEFLATLEQSGEAGVIGTVIGAAFHAANESPRAIVEGGRLLRQKAKGRRGKTVAEVTSKPGAAGEQAEAGDLTAEDDPEAAAQALLAGEEMAPEDMTPEVIRAAVQAKFGGADVLGPPEETVGVFGRGPIEREGEVEAVEGREERKRKAFREEFERGALEGEQREEPREGAEEFGRLPTEGEGGEFLGFEEEPPAPSGPAPGAAQAVVTEGDQAPADTPIGAGISDEEARAHALRSRQATFRQPGWISIENQAIEKGLTREEARALRPELEARGGIEELSTENVAEAKVRAKAAMEKPERPVSKEELQGARQQLHIRKLREKETGEPPRTRLSDAVGALRGIVAEWNKEDDADFDVLQAIQVAERVLEDRAKSGVEATEIDAALEELIHASTLKPVIEMTKTGDISHRRSPKEVAQTKYLQSALKLAERLIEVFDAVRTKAPAAPKGFQAPEKSEEERARDLGLTVEEYRKRAESAPKKPTGLRPKPLETKEDEEEAEAKSVERARVAVDIGRRQGETDQEVFDRMLGLHEQQPRQRQRTSTSKELQQFSTPLPLAWVASELTGITQQTHVYEPTAGHGALLIGSDPSAAIANEIDEKRAATLKRQGFMLSTRDATESGIIRDKSADVVITNPPFGKSLGEGSEHRTFTAPMSDELTFQTKEIDHAIVARALRAMKDNGKAALIVAGVKPFGEETGEARTQKYRSLTQQRFWRSLYETYDVTKHVTLAGKLYDKMGAAWPVDLVIIEGRGKSSLAPPYVEAPAMLETWNDVRNLLPGKRLASGGRPAPDRGPAARPPTAQPQGVPGAPGEPTGARAPAPRPGPGTRTPGGVGKPGARPAGEPGAGGVAGVPPARKPVGERGGVEPGGPGGVAAPGQPKPGSVEGARGGRAPGVAEPRAPEPPTRVELTRQEIEQTKAEIDDLINQIVKRGRTPTTGLDPELVRLTFQLAAKSIRLGAKSFALWAEEMVARIGEFIRPYLREAWDSAVAAARNVLERVGEFQAVYRPRSKGKSVDTLVPWQMQQALDAALTKVEEKTGKTVDEFVAEELGYTLEEAIGTAAQPGYFSAEQIDGLALAIFNMKKGDAFVIGDQTGVGKGRVVAGVLRWAKRHGKVPVFVTAQSGLYADMRRDLTDIGMPGFRQFITNTDMTGKDKLRLDDGEAIESLPESEHLEAMHEIAEAARAKKAPENFDAVFTTYDQMNPQDGGLSARTRWLQRLMPNAILVLDESHKAGGTEAKQFRKTKEGESVPKVTRSETFRGLVADAAGVLYSSATYAKNPHVMTLYSRTDLAKGLKSLAKLPELMRRGGVPLMQAVAKMLTLNGQYGRREKSFQGISIELDTAGVSADVAESATELLRNIFDFDREMEHVRQDFIKDLGGHGGGVGAGGGAVGEAGAKSSSFASVMHNVIGQMLLSLKAREAGRRAVQAWRGELTDEQGNRLPSHKPVIGLANTMEKLLDETIEESNLKPGDELADYTFDKVFDRYLERTRKITIRTPFGKVIERIYIPDEALGALLERFHALKEKIASTNLGEMPASPIDAMIQEMEAAGMKVGEITGRGARVIYNEDGSATLANRESSQAQKKEARKGFNNGELDALVVNQSGATGYSMHATPTHGADVRPRWMFVVQADPNIDTFIQLLGRINRTGQVAPPRYSVLVSELPSEKRPAAVLMKKMASLNANTSASRRSAVSLKNVTDFMNEYGDKALADVLLSEPEVAQQLGMDADRIKALVDREDLARKVTGLLPMLEIPEQRRIGELVEEGFKVRLEEAQAKGENALEATTQDLQAKTVDSQVLTEGRRGSAFTEPSNLETVQITRKAKAPSFAELQERGKKLGNDHRALLARVDEALDARQAEVKKKYAELGEGDENKAARDALMANWTRTSLIADAIKQRIHLLLNRSVVMRSQDESRPAYLIGLEVPRPAQNPLAPSAWKLVLAPLDGDGIARIPISRLMHSTADSEDYIAIEPGHRPIGAEDFPGGETTRRETRYMVTGNILSGFEKIDAKGQIIFYTDDKGETHQGILLRRNFHPKDLDERPVTLTIKQALEFVTKHPGAFVLSTDGILTVVKGRDGIVLSARTRGGKPYYLSKSARQILGKGFDSKRGEQTWKVTTDEKTARRVLEVYARELGTELQATTNKQLARMVTGERPAFVADDEDRHEMMAFPGSVMPDVHAALDWMLSKVGYTRQQQATVGGTVPTETSTEAFIRKYQDTFRGVKTAQAAVTDAGGLLREGLDTYLAEELRRGKTRNRAEKLEQEDITPILDGARKDGISPEEAGEALLARHAPERNRVAIERHESVGGLEARIKRLGQIDGKKDPAAARRALRLILQLRNRQQAARSKLRAEGFGSGYTDAEAAAIMDRIRSGKRAEGFERLFERFDAMIEKVREGWVRDGLKTREEVDALKAQWKYYAPMRSDLDEDEAGSIRFQGTGRGVDVRGQEFKPATGRTTKAEAANVLAYAFTQATQGIIRGEKNRVARTFLRWLRANAELLGEEFAKIRPSQTKYAIVNGVRRRVFDPTFRLAENVLVVHEGGKEIWIEINPAYQNIADGLKNNHADDVAKAVRLTQSFMRYLAGVNTRYNPVFPLWNAIRDAAGAFVNSQEHGMAVAMRTVRDVPLAMAALTKQKLGKSGGGKWDTWAKEYKESGAPIAFLDIRSYEDQLKLIERRARAHAKPGAAGQAWRGLLDVLNVVDGANDIVENSVRFSAYVHAREDLGMSQAKAASWVKNLTVNFERKGDNGNLIGALWLFANAGIQSTARVGQALKHPGVKKLLIGAFFGSMLWDQLQRMIGGEDDDGEDRWDKIPSWVRRHNLVFMYPNSDEYVVVPLPFVYEWIHTAGSMVSGVMSGDVTASKAMLEMLSAAFESFDPIGSGQLDLGDPASILRTAAPTVIDPFVELGTNRDWKGDIILHDWYRQDSPDSQRFRDATGVSVAVAEFVNKATGGDKYEPGLVDVSPETLDHWAGFLFGGMGRSFAQMVDRGMKQKPGDIHVVTPFAAPFKRRIFRELSAFQPVEDFRTIQKAIRIERERAKDEGTLLSRDLGSIWKEGNLLEDSRARRQKAIDAMEEGSEAQRIAQKQLAKDLRSWNTRARKVLLTSP